MDDVKRFIVIGGGGIGSWLCAGLVRMLEWSAPGSALIIIDGDNYEGKNKERQNFKGLGNKAEVLAAELTPDFPATMIIPQPKWIVEKVDENEEQDYEADGTPAAGKMAASTLLCEGDVIYAVVDNDACRKVILEAATKINDIDVFLGGNDEAYFGSCAHYQRRDGYDVTQNPLEYSEEYANPQDRNPGDMSCQERAEIDGGTQTISTNMTVAALLLARTKMVILDGEPDTRTQIYFDWELGKAEAYDRTVATVKETVNT